jgi:hypothetical protein
VAEGHVHAQATGQGLPAVGGVWHDMKSPSRAR